MFNLFNNQGKARRPISYLPDWEKNFKSLNVGEDVEQVEILYPVGGSVN